MCDPSKEVTTGEIEPSRIQGIPLDVLLLLFEQLTGDTRTLCAIGLACHDFRRLSLPFLLRDVDISSHNNGRVPEHDNIMVREAYADYDGDYRPENLVPRQHAFLYLLKDRPELALHVRRFTWTLVWGEIEELVAKTSGNKDTGALSRETMQSIEAETWNMFSRMTSVRDLDLASLHHVAVASIVRDNPAKLFPAVTELRLVGWMHRGLASAIITALDPKQLLRFQFDCLQDEGAMPGGLPMHFEIAEDLAGPVVTSLETTQVDEKLFQCQQAGEILTFPGPMWYTIRLLRSRPLERLAHLKIKLPVCEMNLDVRNFHTMFDKAKELILMTQRTLKSLQIVVGEPEEIYSPQSSSGCGTGSFKRRQPWYTWINACFLREVALALAQGDFPQLIKVKFAGFHILEMLDDRHADDVSLDETRRQMAAARENLGFDPMFTGRKHLDFRMAFLGYDYNVPWNDAWTEILARS